jgi:hypothetical protein
MIKDTTKWNIGITKLSGLMQYRRPPFEEDIVAELHEIITLLEEASGADLSHFRIPPDKMKPRVTSSRPISFSGHPGRVRYAAKKHCDDGYFRSQLSSLASYAPTLRGDKTMDKANPYESLPDYQLEEMMVNRKLKPKRIVDGSGERWVWDRTHAIAELLKSDNPPAPTSVSNVFHIRDSNVVHSSPGAAVSQNIGMKSVDLQKIIADLKQISGGQALSPEQQAQMNVNVGTIELQNNSPHPNASIIKTSLQSALAILEHAAGHVVGEGVIIGIKMYLGIP